MHRVGCKLRLLLTCGGYERHFSNHVLNPWVENDVRLLLMVRGHGAILCP